MLLRFLGNYRDLGLLLMRLGLGAMFVLHGYPKLLGGPDKWEARGKAMENLGIHFLPVAWGFMAALSETLGGLLLALGIAFRPACLFLLSTMVVASALKLKGGGLMDAAHPIELGFVFLGLLFVGPGKLSFDKS